MEQLFSQDLPMVHIFRGDEELVSEFNQSAEKAMEILGIKRSRLNQISGRELRVAKIRTNGYVRPFYRLIDLQEYLAWSRAPVTHKRSTEVIDDVVSRLEAHAMDLKEGLSEEGNALHSTMVSAIQTIEFSLQNQIQNLKRALQTKDSTLIFANQLTAQSDALKEIQNHLNCLTSVQAELELSVSTIKASIADIFVGFDRIYQKLQNDIPSMRKIKSPPLRRIKTLETESIPSVVRFKKRRLHH